MTTLLKSNFNVCKVYREMSYLSFFSKVFLENFRMNIKTREIDKVYIAYEAQPYQKNLIKRKVKLQLLLKKWCLKSKKLKWKDLHNLDKIRTKILKTQKLGIEEILNSQISDIYKYYRKDLTGDHNVRYKR